jgi:hypothetical protein
LQNGLPQLCRFLDITGHDYICQAERPLTLD